MSHDMAFFFLTRYHRIRYLLVLFPPPRRRCRRVSIEHSFV